MIQKLKAKLKNGDIHLKELLKGSSIAFIFKIFGMGLGYIFTLMIAKWYGADTMGLFTLSLTLLNIFVTIGIFGFDNALVKFIAEYNSNNNHDLKKEVYQKALTITIPLGLLLSILLFISADFFAYSVFDNEDLIIFFKITALAILPLVLFNINIAILRGLKKIKEFSFYQSVGILLISILLLISLHAYSTTDHLTILSQVLSIVIISIFSFLTINKYFSKEKLLTKILKYKELLSVSFPMLLSTSFALILAWTDVIMIGIFDNEDQVGIYNVALKISVLVTLPLMAINTINGPQIAELYKRGQSDLKEYIGNSLNLTFMTIVPAFIFIIVFCEDILLFFGKDFLAGSTALLILSIAGLIKSLFGPTKITLEMTGKQNSFFFVILIASTLNIILNYVLIPIYGISGAALATTISFLISNIVSNYIIKKHLGYYIIFGLINIKGKK
ncbi:MAG: oligosaccharide flippase family protein [Sulfurimonas sp.]|nr:oligosaccharide flippase family protein [Sulfurimonas sp.]